MDNNYKGMAVGVFELDNLVKDGDVILFRFNV